jgi:hypothetical protein
MVRWTLDNKLIDIVYADRMVDLYLMQSQCLMPEISIEKTSRAMCLVDLKISLKELGQEF